MLEYLPANIKKEISLRTLKYPLSVYLKLTSNCMLKCEFCSQCSQVNNKIKEFDFENAKKVLTELKSIGAKYIYYTGGEPLMYSKIEELLQFGYSLGFKQILITNGILFSDKEKRKLIKYLISMGVSIHGTQSVHDKLVGNIKCYNKLLNNLSLIQNEYKNIQINVNYTALEENTNYENIKSIAEICKINNWKLTVARLNYIGNGTKYNNIMLNDLIEIISRIKKEGYKIEISNCIAPCTVNEEYRYLTHGCGAGQSIAAIEANGDVKICASSNYVIGNIKKNNFKHIWNSNKNKEYWKLKWLPYECKVCKYILTCKGGCKAELSGVYWKEFCDASVKHEMDKIWSELENQKIELAFREIRKEKKGKYIIINFPARICNRETLKFLLEIDGNKIGAELIKNGKNEDMQKKMLLIAMRKDKLIKIVK